MNRASVQAFALRATAERRKVFGQPATSAGKPLCVAHSAVRSHRDVEAGGFDVLPAFVGRVDMAAYPWFTPVKGAHLIVDGEPYMITEIAKIQLAGEWFFALGKP